MTLLLSTQEAIRISKYVVCQEGRCAPKVDPDRSSDPNIRSDAHKVLVLQGIKVVEQPHVIHYDPLFYDMTCIPEEHSRELSESNILRLTVCSYPLKGSNRFHRAHMGDLFLRAVARAGRALARGAAAASVVAHFVCLEW